MKKIALRFVAYLILAGVVTSISLYFLGDQIGLYVSIPITLVIIYALLSNPMTKYMDNRSSSRR